MNFSLHLDDRTLERLNRAVQATGVTRNRLIGRAVQEWLDRHEAAQWPDAVAEHLRNPSGVAGLGAPAFRPWCSRR